MPGEEFKIGKVLDVTGKVALTVLIGGFGLLADATSDTLSAYGLKISSKDYKSVGGKCKDFVHDMWVFDSGIFEGTHRNNIKELNKAVKKATKSIEKDRREFNSAERRNMEYGR